MPLRGGVGRLMAKSILNFHFDYWNPSLSDNIPRKVRICRPLKLHDTLILKMMKINFFFQFLYKFPFFESWQVCLLHCQDTKIPNSNYKTIKKRKKCHFPFWHPWWTNIRYEYNKEWAGLCKISVVVLVVAKQMAFAKFVRAKYLTF